MIRDYMKEIEEQTQAMTWAKNAEEAAKAALSKYDEEYQLLVHQLQVKHGYAAQAENLKKASENFAALQRQNHRSGVQMVIETVAQMFRANPFDITDTRKKLNDTWHIETSVNTNVNPETMEGCFSQLAKLACDNEWWDKHGFKPFENGLTWVNKPQKWQWEPIVGIGVPASVLERLPEFKEWAESETKTLAQRWAKDWMRGCEGDTIKAQVLYEELKRQLRPDI